MGITIDRNTAEGIFQEALVLARSPEELPQEWMDWTDKVGSAKSRTFTPVFGTALLAKATDPHIDTLSLREDDGRRGYSARSVAKDVFVPCCRTAGIDIRTTGPEPLNSQPFLRDSRVSEDMNVRSSTKADLKALCDCLSRADKLNQEGALFALAAFLRSRIKATGEHRRIVISRGPIEAARLIEATVTFVAQHSEGGKVGQALVAAILDLVYENVQTRKVNDPGRNWSGDVGAFVDGRVSLSVEVKQRPFAESEVLEFINRLGAEGVPRGLVAALNQGSTNLDAGKLSAVAMSQFGLHLDIACGIRRLLLDTLRHAPRDPGTSMALLPTLGLKRLREIEASDEVQQAWVGATTE